MSAPWRTQWLGTEAELRLLLEAIQRACTCPRSWTRLLRPCGAHSWLRDPAAANRLLAQRRTAERLRCLEMEEPYGR